MVCATVGPVIAPPTPPTTNPTGPATAAPATAPTAAPPTRSEGVLQAARPRAAAQTTIRLRIAFAMSEIPASVRAPACARRPNPGRPSRACCLEMWRNKIALRRIARNGRPGASPGRCGRVHRAGSELGPRRGAQQQLVGRDRTQPEAAPRQLPGAVAVKQNAAANLPCALARATTFVSIGVDVGAVRIDDRAAMKRDRQIGRADENAVYSGRPRMSSSASSASRVSIIAIARVIALALCR